jgi:hypothetical protein
MLPSQLPKPRAQVMAQVPELQLAVPFVVGQRLPHVPHWLASTFRFVSQPFARLPSQFPNPEMHAMLQTPPLQLGVPFTALQTLPQVPQFATEPAVFTSQPLVGSPSQFARPALQVMPLHTPPVQAGVPPWLEHTLPQPPQFCVVARLASQPVSGLPSQSPQPALHTMPQRPLTQVGAPFVALHTRPHAAHEVGLARFDSHPFSVLPSQLAKPALHAIWQAPATQAAVPFSVLHTRPQVPQFCASTDSGVSQPVAAIPSQLP